MYALYEISSVTSDENRYRKKEKISLFGSRSGYVPWLLTHQLDSASSEPWRWHVVILDALSKAGHQSHTLVINLKPNSTTPNLSLYELLDVWGYSASGWTPVLLRLRGLFVDEDPNPANEDDFLRRTSECDEPIFSVMYLNGTIRNGVLEGRWTTPRPSPTNSVLLWPETFEYFWNEARPYVENTA